MGALMPCVTMKGLTWQSNLDIEGERDIICTHRRILLQAIPGTFGSFFTLSGEIKLDLN